MKRIYYSIALLLLAAIGFFLFKKNLNSTSSIGVNDFSIANPQKISKIHFASNDRKLGFLTFSKSKDGIWWVENGKNKYKADSIAVSDLLNYVMKKVQLKAPVNDASLEYVNREMALNATLAQFYEGDKLVKKLYVGGRTSDNLGTYMYLPGTDRPCITQIPGHDGYLTPYYNVNINNWRSPALFECDPTMIQSLQVNWPNNPENGFTIRKNGSEPELFAFNGKKVETSRNRLLAYLDMFASITREGGESAGINKSTEKDSIISGNPFFEVIAIFKDGTKRGFQLYPRKVSMETYSPENKIGELKVYETEIFWGKALQSDEIWLVQDAIVHKNLKTLTQLIGAKTTN
ncbi:MAG: DUF4340 domain-containing protein [Bacteroidia bacterium]|nr:DUF4340 domain-containing protein [Bacteroidia bacterium]